MHEPEADQLEAGLILSRLFLDTDISDEINALSRELDKLPVTVDQMEQILIHQVYRVCWRNLATPVGVWDGFDPDWLKQQFRQPGNRMTRAYYGYFGRRFAARCEQWQAIRKRVAELRDRT